MSQQNRQNPRTATPDRSIWREISEDTFRNHLVVLERRTNAIPVQAQVFSLAAHPSDLSAEAYFLPLEVEQKLADDLAYIAAVGEGAQSVSAVCIEERLAPSGLTIRFAAVDAIDDQVQRALQEVGGILMCVTTAATRDDDTVADEYLLKLIVKLHCQKLLGRIRSTKWQKPKYLARTHKKPLWQDFDNLIHRAHFIYPRRKDPSKFAVDAQLESLAAQLKEFENDQDDIEADSAQLLTVVEVCYTFCKSVEIRDYANKLEAIPRATPQIAAAIKTLRQVEKIGAYKRIALDLVRYANQYQPIFHNIEFRYLGPYFAVNSEIGYEAWAKTLHVHAEVQLVVYYDLLASDQNSISKAHLLRSPRIIGTSKYLCYLCYRFLTYHGTFVPSNTHGRLYDQWTIPDLDKFSETTVTRYREVIKHIDTETTNLSDDLGPKEGKRDAWRVEPMTSRQNLLLTLVSETSKQEDHSIS